MSPFYHPFGLSRAPQNTLRNTITLTQAGIVALTIVLAVAGQVGWRIEYPAGTLRSQCTASGCFIYGPLSVSGTTQFNDVTYTWPSADGASGRRLTTNGAGTLSWSPLRASGSLVWFVGSGSAVTDASAAPDALHAMDLRDVVINAKEAPTGAAMIFDINDGGTTVFSTRPQLNDGATTEAGTDVFSDTSIAAGAKVTLDIDQVGSTFAGERTTIMLQYSYALPAP